MFWMRFAGSVWVVFFLLVLVYENILLPSGLVHTRLGLGNPITGLGAVWIAILVIPGIPLIWLGRAGNPILKRFLEGLANDLENSGRNIGRSVAERDGDVADPITENSAVGSARSDRNVTRSTASRGGNSGGRSSEIIPPLRMKVIDDSEGRFSIEVPGDWDEIIPFSEDDYGMLDNANGFGLVSIKRDEPEDLEEDVTTLSEYADYCVDDLLEDEEEISREPIITSQGLVALRIETRMYGKPSSLKLMYLADDLTGLYVNYSLVRDEDALRQMADYSFSTFRDAFDL